MKSLGEIQAEKKRLYDEYNEFRKSIAEVEQKRTEWQNKLYAISREECEELTRIKKVNKSKATMPHVLMIWKNGIRFDSRIHRYWDLYNMLFSYGLPNELETKY